MRRAIALVLLLGCSQSEPPILLATTTSVQDSGLLDALLPEFTRRTGVRVKPVAVGSGEALAMARRGAADVVIAHSPEAELKLMAEGKAIERRTVMTNTFLIVGPPEDPAGVQGASSARDAFARIAKHTFVSRGDKSGTHARELSLWKEKPASYVETGAGMGETLLIADQKGAYTLSDLATFLALRARLRLVVLFEGGEDLVNRYSVILVRPSARRFLDFMTGDAVPIIRDFGRDKHGRPLFVPETK